MAKETKSAAPAGDEAPKRKGKGKLIIIIVVVLVILIGAGAAAMFMMNKDADSEDAPTEQPKKKKDGGKPLVPAYVPLERFTVNLIPETGDQYLQIECTVEAEDLHAVDQIKGHMPKLRNQIMLLLSSKKASELNSKEGKEQLANEMGEQINLVLEPDGKGKGPVKEVLFTSFIIQ